jgi:hypothetical protein
MPRSAKSVSKWNEEEPNPMEQEKATLNADLFAHCLMQCKK